MSAKPHRELGNSDNSMSMHSIVNWVSILFLLTSLACAAIEPTDTASTELVLPLWKPNRLLLIGELHGTEQTPAIVSQLVRARIASGDKPVVIGLEIPVQSQASVDRFLDSVGSVEDRRRLLEDVFWSSEDGRASQSMFELIDSMRQLRAKGGHARVECFDEGIVNGQTRDAGMANHLRVAVAKDTGASWIVLSGNLHTHVRQSTPPMADQPMGSFVGDLEPVSIVVSAPRGSAWNCQQTCGPNAFGSADNNAVKLPALLTDDLVKAQGYEAELRIDHFSASSPARQSR